MNPIFAGERLDWSSTIGLFVINFGMLDYLFFDYLEPRLSAQQFVKAKGGHFHDRMVMVKQLLGASSHSKAQKKRFREFFKSLDRVRDLRNHIAHGHLLLSPEKDGKTLSLTMSLPKNLDVVHEPTSRKLGLDELISIFGELTKLIEEFRQLTTAEKS